MRNENEWHPYSSRPPSRPQRGPRSYRSLAGPCIARTRGIATAGALAFTVAACSTLGQNPAQAAAPTFPTTAIDGPYPVVKVVDGDTITVRRDRATVTVRLLGIDTPEVKDPRKPVQCFGTEASAEARRLLTGQRVYLESDASQDQIDRYGRSLRYVWTADHRLINLHLIEQGFAHEYSYGAPYKYLAAFRDAQGVAREQGRGLWSPNTCRGE
ncbi:thermonuclease family protein [Tsukamurella sp. DT100]|uniref:thermonuclease family protein n=1 Tax=Tsukamurella sp. DT100 TaxID=3393415 RepID=UPI003CECF72D